MRYRLICVAELPDLYQTDDLNQALEFICYDNNGSYYEIYDTIKNEYIPVGPEDYEKVKFGKRINA